MYGRFDEDEDEDMGQNDLYSQEPVMVLPPVVVDGANVACQVGGGKHGSAEAVAAAVAFFRSRGHHCFAFLPAPWARADDGRSEHMYTESQELFHAMSRDGRVVLTPAGSDDDRFAIAYARDHSGFIVSNDKFRDHTARGTASVVTGATLGADLGVWLSTHRISYAFVQAPPTPFSAAQAPHSSPLQFVADPDALARASIPIPVVPPPSVPAVVAAAGESCASGSSSSSSSSSSAAVCRARAAASSAVYQAGLVPHGVAGATPHGMAVAAHNGMAGAAASSLKAAAPPGETALAAAALPARPADDGTLAACARIGAAVAAALLPKLPTDIDEAFLASARGTVERDAGVARRAAAAALVEAADAIAAEAVAVLSRLVAELCAPRGPAGGAPATYAVPPPAQLEAVATEASCDVLEQRPSFVASLVNLAARGDLRRKGATGLLWHESVGRKARIERRARAGLLQLLAESQPTA